MFKELLDNNVVFVSPKDISWVKYFVDVDYQSNIDKKYKYYVYAYFNPEVKCYYKGGVCPSVKGEPFYIGKGTGIRYRQHFLKSKRIGGKTPFYKKLNNLISENEDLRPQHIVKILGFFENEDDAYEYETKLINNLGSKINNVTEKFGPLTNIKLDHFLVHKLADNRGERCGTSKLKSKEVFEILSLIKEGKLTLIEISKLFNVKDSVISTIKNGKSWKEEFEIFCKQNPDWVPKHDNSRFTLNQQIEIIKDI